MADPAKRFQDSPSVAAAAAAAAVAAAARRRRRSVWQHTGATLACDAAYAGVTCSHVGSRYAWTTLIGRGSRSF